MLGGVVASPLTDIKMPGMNGYKLITHEIRSGLSYDRIRC